LIEDDSDIGRHLFRLLKPALRTGNYGIQVHQSGISLMIFMVSTDTSGDNHPRGDITFIHYSKRYLPASIVHSAVEDGGWSTGSCQRSCYIGAI
jgi:hypothetical protein